MFNFFKRKEKPKTIAEISEIYRDQYRQFLNLMGWETLGSKPEILWVYTDLAGHNYYVAKNPWQGVTRGRLAAVEEASAAMERRYTREQGMEALHAILTSFQQCQKGNVEAAHLGYKQAWELYQVTKNSPSDEIMMQYALHLILTDGEAPDTIDPEILKEKRARAEGDAGLKAFFLNMAHSTLNSSLPILPHDGPSSMEKIEAEKVQKREASQKRLAKFMQTGKQKGS